MKILLVEDDDVFIKVLTRTLKAHHYIIDTVKDGEMGWTYGSTFEYDLIMIDIVLPKLDGISLCKRFRAEGYATPILLLTSQDNSSARVQGLDAGADDYVVKPFDQAELVARMRALVRRGSTNPFPLLTWGDLILNPSTCEVSYQGQNLALTTKEYELLELMMRDSQHVFSTDELLDHLWSSEKFPSEATVRSHIRRVRNKLVAIGAPQDFIATLHGRGYYLKVPKTNPLTPQIPTSQHPNQTPFTNHLVTAHQQAIQETIQIQLSPISNQNSPLLLLISADDAFNQSLQAIAPSRGIQVEIMSLLELDTLTMEIVTDAVGQPPDVILLRLLPKQSEDGIDRFSLEMQSRLQTCTWLYPELPIMVTGDRLELGDRLEIVRQGGKLLLDISTAPEQVMSTAINLLKKPKLATKVMIVDDDHHWLRTLPTLLKPWGFKVTTLADPQQFWTVLQAVVPNVLVLDANMPEINGLELCQMLRSDPDWQRLPVLFLSELTDSTSQQQAFSVGADDYLFKPLMADQLANRILNRLQRFRAWTS
jgi:DNA-binding response OmpR family regulator